MFFTNMKFESELCKICPISKTCSPYLIPGHAKGKRLLTNNPWNCRHLTCPRGVDNARKEIKILKNRRIFAGYAYFSSADKPSTRRVFMQTGIIESYEGGRWYFTGQSIHETYTVDPQYFPYRRVRI